MKNMSKILGVILTLAMLAGLIVMATPVSAGNQSWTPIKSVELFENINANVYDMAADGQTMLLFTGDDLYQSTDGGINWSETSVDTDNDLNGVDITMIAISQADSDFVLVSDGNDVYRSRNGARTFSGVSLPITGDVKSIDVSENGNGDEVYLIATEDGIAMYIDGDWFDTVNGNLGVNTFDGQTPHVAAFAPDYADNPAIVAVTSDGAGIYLRTLVTISDMDREWDEDVDQVEILDVAAPGDLVANVAFPSNYSYSSTSGNRVFVGLGSASTDVGGAFTVRAKSDRVYTLDEFNVYSIDFTGTASSGTLAVGLADGDDIKVMISTDANSTSPEFIEMEEWKSPNGDNVVVKFNDAGDTLYAGTSGDGAALFTATDDFTSFDGIAFFSVSDLANVVLPGGGLTGVGQAVQYQKVQDNKGTPAPNLEAHVADDTFYLFRSMDSGKTWKLIFTSNYSFSVALSPAYAEDQTIYLHNASFMPELMAWPVLGRDEYSKSTNGGKTWATYSTLGYVEATSFAVIDANNYWIASSEGIRKTGGSTIEIDGNVPAIMIMIPGFGVVPTTSGDIYVTTDMGATFNRLGEEDTFAGVPTFTFDVPSKTVYVESAGGSIVKWVVGTSTSWETALNIANMPLGIDTPAEIDGLSIGPGGVWYIKSTNATPDNGRIWRATEPLNPNNTDAGYGFEPISGTTFGADVNGENGATIAPGPFMSIVADPASGIPTYYVVVQGGTYTANDYNSTWLQFTDVLLTAPKINAPVEGATVGTSVNIENPNLTNVNFMWSAVSYTGATYEWQIAYDNVFTNLADTDNTKGTSLTARPLLSGQKYFFRVRVSDPMFSKWSTPVSFSTMITSDVNQGLNAEGRIYPTNGAVINSSKPAITWGSVTGATYDFKLAKDAAFTQLVDEKNGLTSTVYSPSSELANGTYFWQVRAVSGQNVGNWVQSAFTVAPAAAAPGATGTQAPPQVTVNPPVITVVPPAVTVAPPIVTVVPETDGGTPATPGYIWVIIAIGAVLVIAVIVLIARTRRV